jgi:hypothetical protein
MQRQTANRGERESQNHGGVRLNGFPAHRSENLALTSYNFLSLLSLAEPYCHFAFSFSSRAEVVSSLGPSSGKIAMMIYNEVTPEILTKPPLLVSTSTASAAPG